MSSSVSLSDLIPAIREVVESGGQAKFIPEGISMQPMLYGGRDTIYLQKPVFPLKKYDIPLYLRADGSIVLHRVVRVLPAENGVDYRMMGDNTYTLESGITENDIVAVLVAFDRKGKHHTVYEHGYLLYARIWCHCYLLRRTVVRFKSFCYRAFSKLLRRA